VLDQRGQENHPAIVRYELGTKKRLASNSTKGGAQSVADLNDSYIPLYYVPGGTHAPHQPTQEWIEKFKGKFDMGWNAMRDQIFANQKRLGVIPADRDTLLALVSIARDTGDFATALLHARELVTLYPTDMQLRMLVLNLEKRQIH
jgi:arylsulfatase A-like enzyme